MKYTDEQKEHIRHCFDSFCKKVIRYQAINLYRGNSKYIAFGYIFSVNDYDLGKALLQLPKKKRDVILMYYFTDYKLKDIAEMIGKSQKNISYINVRALKNLREIMEGGEDE